ncbi:MAG: DUF3106 domain-containing protein [Candidatus Korobacteraceae bacterium]
MNLKTMALATLLVLTADAGWALQRAGGPPPRSRGGQQQNGDQARRGGGEQDPNARKGPPRRGRFQGPGPHAGDWLRRHQDMSWEEQQKALQEDSTFRRLSPDRKDRLVEQMRRFYELPPDQQQRILQRIETFEHLTPEQQARTRRLYRSFRRLPDDRKRDLRGAFAELKNKSPEERNQAIDSDAYRERFSDLERDILRDASGLAGSPN